jgi:hypothetical protein
VTIGEKGFRPDVERLRGVTLLVVRYHALRAATLALATTLLASRVVYAVLEQVELGTTAIAVVVFAANVLFIHRSAATSGDNALLQTWSLWAV